MSVAPSDEELNSAAIILRSAHPSLGIGKLLAQLKLDNPEWSISEKRFKRFLPRPSSSSSEKGQGDGEVNGGGSGSGSSNVTEVNQKDGGLIAQTGIDTFLDIKQIAPKVKVKMFKDGKGKGLVVREKLQMGEMIWQEDPWIATNDISLTQYLTSREMCSQCLTLFPQPNPPLSVPCTFCGEAQFCNRLCYSKAVKGSSGHHDLLCPGQNKEVKSILKLIQSKQNRDLQAVIKIIAKWRGEREWGSSSARKEIEDRIWNSMARVNQRTKEEERREWPFIAKDRLEEWRLTHLLILNVLNPSPSDDNYKPFQRLLQSKKSRLIPLTKEEEERWFSFESFLELLGLVGLNQESSGGLYALHSHLNHSCDPNVQVRNLPKGWTPPTTLPAELPPPMTAQNRGTNKLTIIAKKTIHPGDELLVSYVDQRLDYSERRERLREQYGFYCHCTRCKKEQVEYSKSKA
ncbi:uncharacterized protein IL334_000221 [Kwoniella shivajii]|uniref:Histone-lysine N-methyltransferase SET5 n=1 Tax=Kwoniella shivajii TaxID=564305 RepID=A0ABZ1CNV9_9TREE|nr:hypothetical protein IL334_000221 [Kwoniella shivajii]